VLRLLLLDPDSDGTVSLAEAQAAGAKVFAGLNKDPDGTLDAKELGDRIDADGIKAADPDNDGTLDAKDLNSPAGQALLKLIQ